MIVLSTNPVFTVTISNNEILIYPTADSVMTNASTTRLGYTVENGSTATWANPIWFRFYEPIVTDSEIPLGILRNFQAIDMENKFGYDFNQLDIDTMIALLFANYYSNPTTRTAIESNDPYASQLFQRLAGETPSAGWQTDFPIVEPVGTNFKSVVLFQDFGVGYQLSNEMTNNTNVSIGTLFKEVHFTKVDPLADANLFPAKYRYLSSTKQNAEATTGNQTIGMVIHTNLWDDAFDPPGLLHFVQFLALTPLLARILYSINGSATFYNPMAYINSSLDASMLQKGLGYFNRSARVNTFYGWFGNSLISFTNEVTGGAIILPFMGFSEYLAMKNMVFTYLPGSLPFSTAVPCIWSDGDQDSNIKLGSAKAYVRLIMLYAAWVQVSGVVSATSYIAQTQTNIQTLLGVTPAVYYQSGANALAVGEYGHFFRFAQTISYGEGSNIFATFVQPYLSWQANVPSLQLIALDKISNITNITFLNSIIDLSTYLTLVGPFALNMTAGEETDLTNYTYP